MKPEAKSRTDGQKSHIRHLRGGRVCKTKQSPILPEPRGVNAAVTWDEGYRSYPGRSAGYAPDKRDAKPTHRSNPYRKVWLNPQKSVLPIVPLEPTERIGKGRGRRLINR